MLEVRKGKKKKKNGRKKLGKWALGCLLEVGGSHKKMGEKNGKDENFGRGPVRVGVRGESRKRKKKKTDSKVTL